MHLSHRFHFLLRLKGSCSSFVFQGWLLFGHELGLILDSILVAIIITICGWFEFLGSWWYTTSVGSQLQFFLFCSILVVDSLDFTLQYSTSSGKWLVLCPFFSFYLIYFMTWPEANGESRDRLQDVVPIVSQYVFFLVLV